MDEVWCSMGWSENAAKEPDGFRAFARRVLEDGSTLEVELQASGMNAIAKARIIPAGGSDVRHPPPSA